MRKDYGFRRADRVASEVREIMALVVARYFREPRIASVTITKVRLSDDLRNATVFFAVFPGEDPKATGEILERHSPVLRKEMAKHLRIKYIPRLLFVYDDGNDEAGRIDTLLDQISGDEVQ